MLADVGKDLLDDPIDMRCRGRRQALEVAIDRKRDLQFPGRLRAVPAPGPGRKGWPRARSRRSPAGARSARWSAAIASGPSTSAPALLCLGHERGHAVSAVALIDAATALMALRLLREFIVKLRARWRRSCSCPSTSRAASAVRSARRPVEACRECVEDFADALQLDEPEASAAGRQSRRASAYRVPARMSFVGTEGSADRYDTAARRPR